MAKDLNNAGRAQPAKPIVQPFTWRIKAEQTPETDFTELAHDVARGTSMVLNLLLKDDASRETGNVPLLGTQERGDLLLFAIASAKLLSEAADARIEYFNDRAGSHGVVP